MKEKVTDISEALQALNDEMHSMRETIASQHSDICNLNRNIDVLNRELRKRNKEIERLKSRLSKYETPSKDSGNSSTPPSKEKMKDEVIRPQRPYASLQVENLVAKRGMREAL